MTAHLLRSLAASTLLLIAAPLLAPALAQQAATQQAAIPQATSPQQAQGEPGSSDEEAGFHSLFDGQLLSGWEGNGAWFRIEQQAIVGGNLDQQIPHNFFLCTTRTFADFELRLDVKAVGEGVNGGIQFRSRRVPGGEEVEGYQADVGGVKERTVWGGLYDESRRRRFLVQPDPAAVAALVKQGDWNAYRIRCVGPKIELFLNGVPTVTYTESDDAIPRSGIIGLQIHSGPPSEVWYRNLRIKPL